MKTLDRLNWQPHWTSHMGCLIGCAEYLDAGLTPAEVFGGTGHAFIINTSPDLCPSGPTAWRSMMLLELAANLGLKVSGVFGLHDPEADSNSVQAEAWRFVRSAIDQGLPCYGWELDIAEFYVIHGYDEDGYLYRTFDGSVCKVSKPWQDLGHSDIQIVEVYRVCPGVKQADEVILRAALEQALAHASGSDEMILPGYASGLAAYDQWIEALRAGRAAAMGNAYNAAVWAECRRYAVAYLEWVRPRVSQAWKKPLKQAIHDYQAVAEQLKQVSVLYPFEPGLRLEPVAVDERSEQAALAVHAARQAEAQALDAIMELVG
ncbi:MAG: hypothetical protein JW750_09355 [Anaerolineaceae bacterium]|nr:hypothetical protein [Anaerolineaceae bacterium]